MNQKIQKLFKEAYHCFTIAESGYGYSNDIKTLYLIAYQNFCQAASEGHTDSMHWAGWIVSKGVAGHHTI